MRRQGASACKHSLRSCHAADNAHVRQAPFRQSDSPPAQTLRVALQARARAQLLCWANGPGLLTPLLCAVLLLTVQDLVAYCEGVEGVHIACHERADAAAAGACPFFASGWEALALHPTLQAHVAPAPACLHDATPADTPELKCGSLTLPM